MLITVPATTAHLPLHHLRRQVVQRPAQRLAPAVGCMHAPPKVSNLDGAVNAKQQVFRLNVSVNHVLGVAILQRLGQRGNVPAVHSTSSAQRIHWLVAMLQHRRQRSSFLEGRTSQEDRLPKNQSKGAESLQPLPELRLLDPGVLLALGGESSIYALRGRSTDLPCKTGTISAGQDSTGSSIQHGSC